MNEKPNILKAILLSFLALFVLFVVYLLTTMIVSVLFYVILKIPFIKTVIGWIFYKRGDSPTLFTTLFSVAMSYVAASGILGQLCKNTSTEGLALILTGSYLFLIQLISLIINIVYKEPFLINIFLIVSSISLIIRGKERK